jgi:hypothetical protein
VDPQKVEKVKKLAEGMNCPMMEEYDFAGDHANPDIPIQVGSW